MTSIIALALSVFTALTPVKVHVDGPGYLRFIRDGRVVYAKAATFLSIDGNLGSEGAKVLPEVPIPVGTQTFKVDLQGNVDVGSAHLGRLVLAIFPAGSTSSTTDDFFTFSERPTLTNPGEDAAGVIRVDGDSKPTASVTPTAIEHKLIASQATTRSVAGQLFTISITGEGFFKVNDEDGGTHYTRDGRFVTNENGLLQTHQGFLLEPNIAIPAGATKVTISPLGVVTANVSGNTDVFGLGRITLSIFPHADALTTFTPNTLNASTASGAPKVLNPGSNGAGTIWYGQPETDTSAQLLTKRTTPSTTSTTRTKAPSSTTGGTQIEILVKQHTDVVGDEFTIGDIATVNGPDDAVEAYKKVKIGATAIAGVSRIIDQHYLVLKLRGAGHPEGSYVLVVPDGADVARKVRTVSAQDIMDLAIKTAQDKIGAKIDFHVFGVVHPIVALDGDITLDASDPDPNTKGYTVVITAREGNQIVGTQTVTLVPPAQLGDVKVGDTVKVVLKSGAAMIEVEGRAITSGFVGQKIKVSITASPNSGGGKTTTHTGTVIEAGKVEVDL